MLPPALPFPATVSIVVYSTFDASLPLRADCQYVVQAHEPFFFPSFHRLGQEGSRCIPSAIEVEEDRRLTRDVGILYPCIYHIHLSSVSEVGEGGSVF